jgi:NitT/TauT family transport system substrate-binding protein
MRRIVLAAAFGMLAAAPATAADRIVLMLDRNVQGEHAPFYYGKERGFYDALGIDLHIQEGRGSAATIRAVAERTADFGYADMPSMIRAAAKGLPVISPGVLLQTSPASVIGFEESGIREPRDIRGRVVALTPDGDGMSQLWPLFLGTTGLEAEDVRVVSGDGGTGLDAVVGGRADLLLGSVMDEGVRIEDATGRQVHSIRFSDHGVDVVGSGIVVHKELPDKKPELVRRFMTATTRAVEEAEMVPEDAVAAILEAVPKAGAAETLQEEFELTIPLYRTAERREMRPFHVTDASMAETVGLLVEYGGVDAAAAEDPMTFYTTDYLPE